MIDIRTIALILLPSLMVACEVRHENSVAEQIAEAAPDRRLESGDVEQIPGNSGQGKLAAASPPMRAYYLAEAVKAIEGLRSCSGVRTLYQGKYKATAFWAVACHTGAEFQVAVGPDDTKVLSCEIVSRLGDSCWTTFANARQRKNL